MKKLLIAMLALLMIATLAACSENKKDGNDLDDYIREDKVITFETNDKGETEKFWKEDNEQDVVIRFYRYSERKSMLTIEIIEDYDENGNPISDPTKAVGSFYVLSSYLDTLAQEGDRLLNKEIVTND